MKHIKWLDIAAGLWLALSVALVLGDGSFLSLYGDSSLSQWYLEHPGVMAFVTLGAAACTAYLLLRTYLLGLISGLPRPR